MLSADEFKNPSVTRHHATTLQEIHQATISVHHAKAGFNYPIIRLPHTLSALVGLPIRIYQTVYEGALAFLVVVSSSGSFKKQFRAISKR
jgi:hypothetical protein